MYIVQNRCKIKAKLNNEVIKYNRINFLEEIWDMYRIYVYYIFYFQYCAAVSFYSQSQENK